MADWAATRTADGRAYYWNKVTKVTQWTRPDDFDGEEPPPATPATPAASKPEDWAEAATGDGRKYWYNKVTRETTWERPEVLKKQPPTGPSASRQEFVAGGSRNNFEDRAPRRDDRGHGLPQKPSFDGPRGPRDGGMGGGGMPWDARQENTGYRGALAKNDEPEYGTAAQAEEAFFKLLKRHNIPHDSEWREVLRLVVRDREYRAIKDPRERKQAFDKYCREAREQEREKEKERQERLRVDFRNMLSTHDDIKHYTRWKTARPLIEREAVFKSAANDDERRKMFEEYMVELKKKHAEDEVKRRKTAMHELDSMVKALIIDPNTRWVEGEEKIMNSDRFHSDEIFKGLHKHDVLFAFDTHLKALERVTNDALQKEKLLRYRRQRQARDAFKQMLNEKQQEGKIKAGTKWQDFRSHIVDDPRYIAYLGMEGSDPLELFWDVVEDEERKFRSRRNDAMDVLEDKRWEMTLETKFEDFAELMSHDPKTADLGQEELHMIFDRLLEKVKRREDQSRINAERHQRDLVDALRSAIKRLEPPVRLDDTYEDVSKRLSGHRDFEAATDDTRRGAYDKYMRRLKERERDDQERERRRRDRDADSRNGSRRDDRDRERRHRTRTRSPELDVYEADRRKAQEARERIVRKPSFGLTPPPRDRRDDRYDRYDRDIRRHDRPEPMSIYDRERRERELERERSYISRADPRDKGRTLDYGDDDAVGSRPGSIRKRRESGSSVSSGRQSKRPRRTDRRTPDVAPESLLKEEPPALQSGSEEGEIEEI